MSVAGIIFRPWYWFAGKIFATWARPTVQPENPAELIAGTDAPVCYVLEHGGLADTLALERLCQIHGLPSPTSDLPFADIEQSSRTVVLRRKSGLILRKVAAAIGRRSEKLAVLMTREGGKPIRFSRGEGARSVRTC